MPVFNVSKCTMETLTGATELQLALQLLLDAMLPNVMPQMLLARIVELKGGVDNICRTTAMR
jgi:predicted lipid carrier protein YhbT